MKDESTSKAKAPAAKRAQKSAAKNKKAVGVSKGAGTRSKKAAVKAKAPAAAIEKIKPKAAEKSPAKRKRPAAETKIPPAKTRKRTAKVEETTEFRIGEPVLDPIGDVISGEARTYLGGAEAAALGGTLEAGPGMAAATGAAGVEEEEAKGEAGAGAQTPAKLERLQKILSRAGIASRRRAEEMIVAGRVMVNGQVVTQLGSKADPARDHIRVDGKLLQGAERHRYFVLNKPRGYVTTVSDPEGRPTVMEFFAKMHERLYPVGRLDYQSEGLLLMTNDGELANLVTKAGSGVEKTYLVKVAGQPSEEELERLRGGVAIERDQAGSERVRTAPARIRQVRVGENPWYEVVLTEGRNRELRKMFAAIGHFAEKIRRVGYGPLVLDVEPGKLRELSADEVNALRLTAEGKMKPRRMRVDLTLPKEAGRAAEKRGERPARQWRDKSTGKRVDVPRGGGPRQGGRGRDQETKGTREQGFERPRGERYAGKPGGFRDRPRPSFGERRPFSGGQRPFGGGRPSPVAKPGFERAGFKRPEFGGKPRGQATGGFENAPRKPFREQGERPTFVRPEGSFKRGDGPKRRFEGDRGKGFGGGAGKRKEWTPKPGRWRNEERRGQTGSAERPAPALRGNRWAGKGAKPGAARPKPAFGARPGGFLKPGKPGGANRGGSRFGRRRPEGR
jgi:23S rRNA pseudouridine2605 synthase